MAKPVARIAALQAAVFAGMLGVLVRAGYLQLVRGKEYAAEARRQRTERRLLEARRGTVYDRNGAPLATSQEYYHIGIAPNEVRDTGAVLRLAARDLRIRIDSLRRAFRTGRRYVYYHGPFTASQVDRLRGQPGIHLESAFRRAYPSGPLARPIIGALDPDSATGESGLERFLDSLLQGVPGEAVYLKDLGGRLFESPGRLVRYPVAGNDVVLTLDAELQGIAETALADALTESRADAGDIVFLDPRSGELLAAASRVARASGKEAATASIFLTGFEPGSTAKPFTAAALLALGRVSPEDTVSGENGRWTLPVSPTRNRVITDDHAQHVPITLARAIQVSSNIGMVKFSLRLTPEEHYEMLRAFGFGSPSGIEFPVEASGSLTPPHRWLTGYTSPSLAMGYELLVTPIQLAAAYAAIANDGVLLAPSLIKEVRAPDGPVIYRHRSTVVRRVISSEVASTLREYLASAATDSGTGGRAQVRFGVIGKTGTAKLLVRGHYQRAYAASFAGIFPVKDPQLVVTVRIQNPRGQYYGGLVAAPITARMLRQALAARRSAINRSRLMDAEQPVFPRIAERAPLPQEEPSGPVAVSLPLRAPAPRQEPPTEVPDVSGQSVRRAALALHQRGFRVRLVGLGRVLQTVPAPGDSLPLGRTVGVYATPKGPSR